MTRRKLSAAVVVGSAVGLASLLAVGAAAARQAAAGAEKELRAQAELFAAGWNHGDAKAMAALFAVDADLINPFAAAAKGRAGIEKFFAAELGTLTKGTTFTIKDFSPRLLHPGLAVEDMDVEIAGGTLAPDPAKPLKNHAFLVVKKQGGKWLAVSLRAWSYLLPPPPPPAAAAPK
jgi:uncharacterized protein (TIGR02246 family)